MASAGAQSLLPGQEQPFIPNTARGVLEKDTKIKRVECPWLNVYSKPVPMCPSQSSKEGTQKKLRLWEQRAHGPAIEPCPALLVLQARLPAISPQAPFCRQGAGLSSQTPLGSLRHQERPPIPSPSCSLWVPPTEVGVAQELWASPQCYNQMPWVVPPHFGLSPRQVDIERGASPNPRPPQHYLEAPLLL